MATESLLEHIRTVLAEELALVQDEVLREKVVRTWVRSMELSGATDLGQDLPMNPDVDRPGIGLEHIRAVARLSAAIAGAVVSAHTMPVNRDVTVAGALLHDVGKLMEHAPAERHALAGTLVRHPFSGVGLAMQEGLPAEVLHIIAYHAFEGQRLPRTLEGEIVYRADSISADVLYRRERGIARSERTPYVYLPRMPIPPRR